MGLFDQRKGMTRACLRKTALIVSWRMLGRDCELGLEAVGMMLMRTWAWDLYQVKAGGW